MSVLKYGRTFPEFVKRFRYENNLSQQSLAYQMGIHAQYVSNVERGVQQSHLGFAALLLPVVDEDRKKYLLDLIAEESSMRSVRKLKSKAMEKWAPKTILRKNK